MLGDLCRVSGNGLAGGALHQGSSIAAQPPHVSHEPTIPMNQSVHRSPAWRREE